MDSKHLKDITPEEIAAPELETGDENPLTHEEARSFSAVPLPNDTHLPGSQPASPGDSVPDLTQICWTQLLRETEPDMVGPQLPLPPLPKIAPEDLFK